MIDKQTENKPNMLDLAEIFLRVSGDIQAVKDHMEGKRVVEWSYLDDSALTLPEGSAEYRCLVATKGREEIEKRKKFLLNW